MSQREKLFKRLLLRPKDFSWQELRSLLQGLGYREVEGGKTGGSRRRFVHEHYPVIILHKPHPGTILKRYQLDQVIEVLTKESLV